MNRIFFAVLPAAFLLAACAGTTTADPNLSPGDTATKAGGHTVVYTIDGTAKKGSVTYTTPSGQEQDNDAKLPWTKTLKAGNGEALGVNAQNSGGGEITCEIKVDGKVVKKSSSKGEYSVVSCDALIGF